MQNEPQLSAEMEKRFDIVFDGEVCDGTGMFNRYIYDELKHFLATALEEQRAEYVRKVEELFGNSDVYLLPKGVKKVYGYSKDKKTRVSAMYVTNEVALLTQKEAE